MTENIVEVGSQNVAEVQDINKSLVEKSLRMRCLAYLSQIKSELLVETIHDMNDSRKEMAELSFNLTRHTEEIEKQKQIIEQQKRELLEKNRHLAIENELLELKVEERAEIEKQAEEILRRSQKMDSMGKLTGGLAHDYNNMLNVILGYAELLESALVNEPKLKKYAKEICNASDRGAKLTRKLLDFSKSKPVDAAVVNINTVLLEERNIIEKTLTARIELVLDLADELCPVWVDANDLENAILNMVINAMHAIDNHGRVVIKTRKKTLYKLDAHILQLDMGEYAVLSISDTGRGMDNATRERIFEPFFSTKGAQGTGLGLSQVYGFVERSHGAIKVYSEPGNGTRFSIYFPCHKQAGHLKQLDAEYDDINLNGDESILVVDDESSLVSLSSEILSDHGYKVFGAENAEDALKILEQESINLMLSDVIMPELNGYQLAAIVRDKYPDIKIQLASGFTNDRNLDVLHNDLHDKIIYKPYRAGELLKRIRDLLDNRL